MNPRRTRDILSAIAVFAAAVGCASLRGAYAAEDARLASELETSFQRHIAEAWYPISVDTEHGGFWSEFDADWKRTPRQDRFIVSQARHLWMVSEIALFTGEARFRAYADHGYAYLRDVFWDGIHGGFHSDMTFDGEVIHRQGKIAYGNAFAIYGLSSYYALTRDESALDLAKETFRWLERHSWDAEFGGYVDKLNDDGSWRGSRSDKDLDAIDEQIGLKDYNSTIHLLEAFTALYHHWKDPLLARRLEQLLELTRDRLTSPEGYLRLFFFPDWTHVDHSGRSRAFVLRNRFRDHVTWGHNVETAFLMLEASRALGLSDDAKTLSVARRMVDHALESGWDAESGGLFEAGYYFKDGSGIEVISEEKVWWVEAEAMNAFLLFSKLFPEEPKYRQAFLETWDYNRKCLIDHGRGGWYASGLDRNPEAKDARKAQIWKACYHDGRAYLNCIKMLRGEFELLK